MRRLVDELEETFEAALQGRYSRLPPDMREALLQLLPVRQWSMRDFLDRYLRARRYPVQRLNRVIYDLLDVKLQLYYVLEVDLNLYDQLVYHRGYNRAQPLANPDLLLTRLSLDQSLIAKSPILWERIMNFVFHLETGERLENKVSGRKSKQKAFFEFVDVNPHWRFLEPYADELQDYDDAFRTAEVHKSSVLRAEILGRRQIHEDDLLALIKLAMNATWPNILEIVGGGDATHFTDLHRGPLGGVDERFTG